MLTEMRKALADDKTVRFNTEVVDGVELVIVAYMISNDELWAKDYGLETRGITFRADTGEIVSRPFEKFFNVGEKAWTQPAWVERHISLGGSYVAEKRDGSMITPVVLNGQVFLKTKKSFYSDVALDAQASMTPEVELFCRYMDGCGLTPIFEFTSPRNKVVINYGDGPEFVLLAARDKKTGEYMPYELLETAAVAYGVKVIQIHNLSFGEMTKMVETTEGIEGWVIYTAGARFKIKTKWYCDRHRFLDLRERDVARFVLDDVLDDMKPELLMSECDFNRILEIEEEVAHGLAATVQSIEDLTHSASQYSGMDQINFIKSEAGALQKFVFRAIRGQDNSEEAIKEFYRSRFLGEFSLRSVGNPKFGHGDDDE